MKTITIFKIIFGIWLLDFISTIIALNFFDGLIETTKLPSYLFSLGWYGYILCLFLTALVLFTLSMFIYKSHDYILIKFKNDGMAFLLCYLSIGIFVMMEFFVIVNNIIFIRMVM